MEGNGDSTRDGVCAFLCVCVCVRLSVSLRKWKSGFSFLVGQEQVTGEKLMCRTIMRATEHINVDQLAPTPKRPRSS